MSSPAEGVRGARVRAAVAAFQLAACGCGAATRAAPAPARASELAAPGRVEGASETAEVSAALDGRLASVSAREGAHVREGDELARLSCDDLTAEAAALKAAADAAREALSRVARGARDEERRASAADAKASGALLARARELAGRTEQLFLEQRVVAEDARDQARRELAAAEARYSAAVERHNLLEAGPLPEELSQARAEARAAEHRAAQAAARLDKCVVRAPRDGVVLRVHREAGEAVSLVFPSPIVSLADTSRFRVRAEVDERDVGGVRPGQRVSVTADALGAERLPGVVIRRGEIMGRKHVRTGDPAEKADRDVLEALVELERQDARLVVGLRVTVLFSTAASERPAAP